MMSDDDTVAGATEPATQDEPHPPVDQPDPAEPAQADAPNGDATGRDADPVEHVSVASGDAASKDWVRREIELAREGHSEEARRELNP